MISKTALKSLQIMGIIIGCIAALIMMGVIGRVIADGRRETAVFRAIGATRNDMRLVYTMYTALFSLIIVVVSIAIGLGFAVWLDAMYAADISTQMHLCLHISSTRRNIPTTRFLARLTACRIWISYSIGISEYDSTAR